jgi:hypothetical protein
MDSASKEEENKRKKELVKSFERTHGHRIVGFATSATVSTLPAGLARAHEGEVSKGQNEFLKDLKARPSAWIKKGLLIDLDQCTFFPQNTAPQVWTLPCHHSVVFPLTDITNRQKDCCGLTNALLDAMSPYAPELGRDEVQMGSFLRVSAAVAQAKKIGDVRIEVTSGKHAVPLYRAYTESMLPYPPKKLDVAGALRAIATKPLKIRHPVFLVSSKKADKGHYLSKGGGFPSLRQFLPDDLLEAIEYVDNTEAAKKALKRSVMNKDETSGTKEEEGSEEMFASGVDDMYTGDESECVSDDFMYPDF